MSKTASNNKMSAVPYDTVKFRVPNGSKEKLIQYAKEHGYSLNALICDALSSFQHSLDGAITEPPSAFYSTDGINAASRLPRLENPGGHTVASLYSGMGSICLAFAQAGFDIVKAYEEDHAACEAFQSLFGSARLAEGNLRCIDRDMIPDAEVIVSGFPPAPENKDYFDTFNYYEAAIMNIVNAVESIKPSFFYMELDDSDPSDDRHDHDSKALEDIKEYLYILLKEKLSDLNYNVTLQAFKAPEWAPLPLSGKKRYIVAALDDFSFSVFLGNSLNLCTYKPAVELIQRSRKQDSFFYYRSNTELGRNVISSVKSRNNLYLIRDGKVYDSPDGRCPMLREAMINKRDAVALRDDFGVRQLTPGEFLMFKGYPAGITFPSALTLEDRYRLAGGSAVIPVTWAIAEYIKQYMDRRLLSSRQ